MDSINVEKFMILERYNKKLPGGRWEERERYNQVSIGVLSRSQWENEKAVLAGGVESVIGITANFKFLPLYRTGGAEQWTSTAGTKFYGRYDQAQEWLSRTLEQFEEE